jgi:glycosyltransferase involved in cell wall biosynthesis
MGGDLADDSSIADLVSVIVPAYNAAGFIAEALDSALSQTYSNLEVIVVDDGSTDDTAEIVEAVVSRDPRVRLLRQKNCGVAAARNRGIEQSRGALIAPLDADDLWRPDKIAKQVAAMRSGGQGVAMVYAWSVFIDESGRVLPRGGSFARHEGEVFPFLLFRNFIGNGSAPLLRRDHVLEVGGYDATLRARGGECEDLMLYLRIAERFGVTLVPTVLVGYRLSRLSLSHNVQRMKRGHQLVLEAIRARHPELPSRLFRWSMSFNCMYLGRRCLRRGDLRAAAWLFGCAFAHDPAILFEPPFRRTVGRLISQFAENAGRTESGNEAKPKFLDPWLELSATPIGEIDVFSRRRYAFLNTLVSHPRHRKVVSHSLESERGRSKRTRSA